MRPGALGALRTQRLQRETDRVAEREAKRHRKEARAVQRQLKEEAAAAKEAAAQAKAVAKQKADEEAKAARERAELERRERFQRIKRKLDATKLWCSCKLTTGIHLEKCRFWQPFHNKWPGQDYGVDKHDLVWFKSQGPATYPPHPPTHPPARTYPV